MSEQNLNLAQLFQRVAQTLNQKREDLNAADTYNHDHGDHVIEVFELLTQVAKEYPGADAGELLERASQRLKEKPHGTAQTYAQNLSQGAQRLRGQPVTQQSLPLLIQALLGTAAPQQSAQAPSGGGLTDLLGALMGGAAAQGQGSGTAADPLGGLLGALMGGAAGESTGQEAAGLDMGDLVRAGAAFLQASQSGKSTTEAALDALVAATGMGQTPHRAQSAKLVVQALMQAAQSMGPQR